MKWYTFAAEQGFAAAQFNLGNRYRSGQGIAKNDQEAVKWYRLAAEQGLANAQFNLGVMYENGTGVAEDFSLAYVWYSLAQAQGQTGAVSNKSRLSARLSQQALAEAQAQATRCF